MVRYEGESMLASDVTNVRFAPTKWREGYDQREVDDFLDRVRATLAGYEAGRPVDPLTPEDVTLARFQPTKFREGYRQDEVDDFLDRVVVALRQHTTRR
jgi:DivIVA domain-containing protein